MLELIVALAVVFNLVVVMMKLDRGLYANAALDAALLIAVIYIFSGSTQLLVIGTIASALVSLYLSVVPPKFLRKDRNAEEYYEEY